MTDGMTAGLVSASTATSWRSGVTTLGTHEVLARVGRVRRFRGGFR